MNELEAVVALIKAFGDPEPKPGSVEHKISKIIDILNSPSTSTVLRKISEELIARSKSAIPMNERNTCLLLASVFSFCAETQAASERALTGR
ncbi:hypothetical protein GCN74_03500 [Janthinobacterium sp. FT14W]|uniref:hypothetical protein n=1 Tax=Janthinobacterium sp. FT14W TaxID=2654253 RepID=UPI0012648A83|nr:hypothetical protein [Janthinobacterium sp. FT14W]KAB8062102.1 hypothetical protein GCN74_03500 [Janthinobacterium sp. FT14W]